MEPQRPLAAAPRQRLNFCKKSVRGPGLRAVLLLSFQRSNLCMSPTFRATVFPGLRFVKVFYKL